MDAATVAVISLGCPLPHRYYNGDPVGPWGSINKVDSWEKCCQLCLDFVPEKGSYKHCSGEYVAASPMLADGPSHVCFALTATAFRSMTSHC